MAKHSSLHAEPNDEKGNYSLGQCHSRISIFISTNPHPSRPRLRPIAHQGPESSCKAYREDPVLRDVGNQMCFFGAFFFGVGGPV
jgi:hypothetical protein